MVHVHVHVYLQRSHAICRDDVILFAVGVYCLQTIRELLKLLRKRLRTADMPRGIR